MQHVFFFIQTPWIISKHKLLQDIDDSFHEKISFTLLSLLSSALTPAIRCGVILSAIAKAPILWYTRCQVTTETNSIRAIVLILKVHKVLIEHGRLNP